MTKDEKPQGDVLEAKLIRELAAILEETGLSEVEIEKSGLRIRVARTINVVASAHSIAHASGQPQKPAGGKTELADHPGLVTSPMVGTAYVSPSPGASPFVKIGDSVTEGQTVLIIEAMKTMNQIPAPRSGKVVKIIINDSQPVEFGEPLMIIE